MKHVKQLLLAAACAAGLSATAFAQQTALADHGAHQPQGAASAAAADMSEGEVRKVDKSAGKITVKHGEIKNLDMPPMTMVFGVKDAAMLDKVKQGDKVRFRAASQEGKFTITEIQAATQ
ncbi:copper-binding protein [Caenimonas sedimenti]|uniref:Copper-binding protein n=1 Tax=Caenimonas sedimenti TaxID=2596921 RepID=A0A562ZNV1_9BURK|nr:copper-binding protein [Caenimonas sedimenti]TWO70051.1 copper-binding protein [Caenimonas sedimenti]